MKMKSKVLIVLSMIGTFCFTGCGFDWSSFKIDYDESPYVRKHIDSFVIIDKPYNEGFSLFETSKQLDYDKHLISNEFAFAWDQQKIDNVSNVEYCKDRFSDNSIITWNRDNLAVYYYNSNGFSFSRFNIDIDYDLEIKNPNGTVSKYKGGIFIPCAEPDDTTDFVDFINFDFVNVDNLEDVIHAIYIYDFSWTISF